MDRGAVGTRVFRAICKLRTNELLLRHLMADLDGPASSKEMNVLHVGKTTYLDGSGSWCSQVPQLTYKSVGSTIPLKQSNFSLGPSRAFI